jgi:hypothetical protein
MKSGIELIAEERKRQIEKEGWTAEHDFSHTDESMAIVASLYALPNYLDRGEYVDNLWPMSWGEDWWKPSPENRIRELQKAGALIAAEIDRLNNQTPTP